MIVLKRKLIKQRKEEENKLCDIKLDQASSFSRRNLLQPLILFFLCTPFSLRISFFFLFFKLVSQFCSTILRNFAENHKNLINVCIFSCLNHSQLSGCLSFHFFLSFFFLYINGHLQFLFPQLDSIFFLLPVFVDNFIYYYPLLVRLYVYIFIVSFPVKRPGSNSFLLS